MSNQNFFSRTGNTVFIKSSRDSQISNDLDALTYTVRLNQMTGEYFLEIIDNFTLPKKIYGDTKSRTDKVIQTFMSRPRSTGVMFSGFKGAGKTVQMKEIAETLRTQHACPVIVVNEPHCGDKFKTFVESITTSSVIVFDEFEKVYSDEDDAQAMLTLFDGVIETHKLWLLSMNSDEIDENMINRPGRMFYHFEYDSMDESVISDVIDDALKVVHHAPRMKLLAATMDAITMDILTAIIEEVNRYDIDPFKAASDMNVNPQFLTRSSFSVDMIFDGKPVDSMINRVRPTTCAHHPASNSYDFYLYSSSDPESVLTPEACNTLTHGDSKGYIFFDSGDDLENVKQAGRGRYVYKTEVRGKEIEVIFTRRKSLNFWDAF